jgi:hypothetical protein
MAERSPRLRLPRLAAAALTLALLLAALPALHAQSDVRYFAETGHTLRGAFRYFWEGNGAIDTFGYPITEEFTGGSGRLVQWFERARFELVVSGGQYRVELGALGVEATQGRVFPKSPPIESGADRRYIPETQHIIQYGFKEVWESRGDVRIFGYPISDEIDEVLDDGEWHTVQYFERARFEYWPELPPGQRVLISLLGRRLAPTERLAPVPPPAAPQPQPTAPPAAPRPQPPAPQLPPSQNARVVPESGPPGTVFSFEAGGFEPGERVGVWITAPDQSTFGADFQATADGEGSIASARIGLTTDGSFPEGIWSFNAEGVRSGRQAVGYFRISAAAAPGDPSKLGLIVHDQLPRQGDALIIPVAAPAGYTFFMAATGFAGDEEASAWVTGPDGASAPIDQALVEVADGTATAIINTGGLPDGVYTAVIQGRSSDLTAAAGFKLTRDYVAGPGTLRPANANGSATPPDAGPGTVVQIRGQGLRAGEPLEFWITDPSGAYVLLPETPRADGQGRIGVDPPLDLQVTEDALPGVYGIHFRGQQSGARVDVYFTVSRPAAQGVASQGRWAMEQARVFAGR